MKVLTVLSETDSFAELWPALAVELGLELCLSANAEEAARAARGGPMLLAVPGREEEAEPLLRRLQAGGAGAMLVVGALADHRLAISLVQAGAADYFALPPDLEALRSHLAAVRRAGETRTAREELARAQRSAFDFSRIIGRSPQLRLALERAARIIPRDGATVLITGETGTGKELLAQAIHYNGPRAAAAFVEVNCAAIPANLLEAELFGYEKGAFTDARAAKPGLFEAADGGTLFLDEIGNLPLELQGKLLKAIEEKQIRRVGAVNVRAVDVRVLAATHVELEVAVRNGDFREDLYYRLNVIPIHLPPLRERGDDVIFLAEHFLAALAERYGLPAPPLPVGLRGTLLAHAWHGNVRELRNALERALLLGDGGLDEDDLFPTRHDPGVSSPTLPFPAPLATIERAAARLMVERLEGNKKSAADALGISRSRLYRLLEDPLTVAE